MVGVNTNKRVLLRLCAGRLGQFNLARGLEYKLQRIRYNPREVLTQLRPCYRREALARTGAIDEMHPCLVARGCFCCQKRSS